MKAQSAIEYLVTYGWMLAAVSVAGGAVYNTIGAECVTSTSGFTDDQVQISNFGTSANSNNISLQVENMGDKDIEITNVKFNLGNESRQLDFSKELATGESSSLGISGFKQSESCNTIDVDIIYDRGVLEGVVASGTLAASIEFDETKAPITPDSFSADYPSLS